MFDPKHPDSREAFAFDFTGLLAVGETLTTPVVTVSVIRGVDATPAAMLGGAPTVNGSKVNILLIGGVDGVIYCVKCETTTSAGQTLVLESDLLVTRQC